MMERPDEFNTILSSFLASIYKKEK